MDVVRGFDRLRERVEAGGGAAHLHLVARRLALRQPELALQPPHAVLAALELEREALVRRIRLLRRRAEFLKVHLDLDGPAHAAARLAHRWRVEHFVPPRVRRAGALESVARQPIGVVEHVLVVALQVLVVR